MMVMIFVPYQTPSAAIRPSAPHPCFESLYVLEQFAAVQRPRDADRAQLLVRGIQQLVATHPRLENFARVLDRQLDNLPQPLAHHIGGPHPRLHIFELFGRERSPVQPDVAQSCVLARWDRRGAWSSHALGEGDELLDSCACLLLLVLLRLGFALALLPHLAHAF